MVQQLLVNYLMKKFSVM